MRSRLRSLHVEGREYTWKADVRSYPGPDGRGRRYIRVRAWGAGKTGRAVQADLLPRPRPAGDGLDAYPYPDADDVRVVVRHALATGWAPDTVGGTFVVAPTSDLALPDFVIAADAGAAKRTRLG